MQRGWAWGLLFYGAAEPLTHFSLIAQQLPAGPAVRHAMFVTNFNWALHAWCIYAITALVIAYYAYRKGQPGIIGTPIRYSFRRAAAGSGRWPGSRTCSPFWFGVFGGLGFYAADNTNLPVVDIAVKQPENTTFFVLNALPLGALTVAAAFLFLMTSVVSAAFVLSMFSTGGQENPPVRIKLIWGLILAALGLAMMLTGDTGTVRAIIALGAIPFVFILPLLAVAFLKTLKTEEGVAGSEGAET